MSNDIQGMLDALSEDDLKSLRDAFLNGLGEIAKRNQTPEGKPKSLTLENLTEAEANLVTDVLAAHRAPDKSLTSGEAIPNDKTLTLQGGRALVSPKNVTFGGDKPRKWNR
jgi:hypothetical protein